MTIGLVGILMLALAEEGAASWQPPRNPDPHAILHEARDDAHAGHHELALAKHEWIQRQAVQVSPAFYGVRLSFALSNWVELGRSYPPALASLRRFRDEALAQVLAGKGGHAPFHDFASINDALDEPERTSEAFLRLDQENPRVAKDLYGLAAPALVRAKAYAVCGRYIQAEQDWAQIAFTRATGKMLGLEVARKARAEWDDAAFQQAIDTALKGQVPPPFP